jgi:hypothetical protein
MNAKFGFRTMDNSDFPYQYGEDRRLFFDSHLIIDYFEGEPNFIELMFESNGFKDEDNKKINLGTLSIEETKVLIKALQLIVEGK